MVVSEFIATTPLTEPKDTFQNPAANNAQSTKKFTSDPTPPKPVSSSPVIVYSIKDRIEPSSRVYTQRSISLYPIKGLGSFEMFATLKGKEMGINTDSIPNEGRFVLGYHSRATMLTVDFLSSKLVASAFLYTCTTGNIMRR